jgi:hypothetical protein
MIVKCGRSPNFVESLFQFASLFLRPVWSFILSIVFWVYALLLFIFSQGAKKTYIFGKKAYDRISTLGELVNWSKVTYRYIYDDFGRGFLNKDKLRGWLDHDGSKFEFFTRGGADCDGLSLMVKRKLLQLGYEAVRVNMIAKNDIKSGHFDCLFIDKDTGKYCLFNYGTIRYGDSVQDVFKSFGSFWFTYENVYYFKWWF